ncbi:hypothetical protein CEXT_127191, partial [Caerostris extrusa]
QVSQIDGVPRTIEVQGSLFTFQQLHFHWEAAPIAHFVHTNDDNTIAVVAVFLQASSNNNDGFKPIADALSKIPFKDDSFELQSDFNMEKLLADNPSGYYHYKGS